MDESTGNLRGVSQAIISHGNFQYKISHHVTEQYPLHMHNFYELLYFLHGDVCFICGEREQRLQQHTLLFIPPNIPHAVTICSNAEYERYIIHFEADLINAERRNLLTDTFPDNPTAQYGPLPSEVYVCSDMQNSGVLDILRLICRCFDCTEDARKALAPIYVEALLATLQLHLHERPCHHEEQSIPQIQRDMLLYINGHFTEPISLDDLASRFFISRSAVNRIFHTVANASVREYITRKRIAYAQDLLMRGVPTVQVARLVGFGDYSSFYRAYKKFIGHAPCNDKLRNATDERPKDTLITVVQIPPSRSAQKGSIELIGSDEL